MSRHIIVSYGFDQSGGNFIMFTIVAETTGREECGVNLVNWAVREQFNVHIERCITFVSQCGEVSCCTTTAMGQ